MYIINKNLIMTLKISYKLFKFVECYDFILHFDFDGL